jgi:UDP-N-acetylglucosamine acyltransferase
MAVGDRARLVGLNLRGLQRRNFSKEEIQALRSAYTMLFADEKTLVERVEDVAQRFAGVAPVERIIAFIRADSGRTICQPEAGHGEG